MDPMQLFLDPQAPFTQDGKPLSAAAWKFLQDLKQSLTTIDVGTQVTGVLLGANGGTGISNGTKTITLHGNLATSGNFALTLTVVADTNITLPTTGSLQWSQTQRVTTGVIGAGASALITVTWPVTFGNTNYTPVVSVLDATAAAASLTIVHIESVIATAITVRVLNSSAGNITGTVQAIGLHD